MATAQCSMAFWEQSAPGTGRPLNELKTIERAEASMELHAPLTSWKAAPSRCLESSHCRPWSSCPRILVAMRMAPACLQAAQVHGWPRHPSARGVRLWVSAATWTGAGPGRNSMDSPGAGTLLELKSLCWALWPGALQALSEGWTEHFGSNWTTACPQGLLTAGRQWRSCPQSWQQWKTIKQAEASMVDH